MNQRILNLMGPYIHMIAGVAPLMWIHATTSYTLLPSIGLIGICMFLGLLPDIDTESSSIGRLIPELSKPIERNYGHRTITHSWIGVGTVAVISYIIDLLTGNNDWIIFTAAYSSHLVVDCTVGGATGIDFIWPIKRKINFGEIAPASIGELIYGIVIAIIAVIPLTIPAAAQTASQLIPAVPTATLRPTIAPTPAATPVVIRMSNVQLEHIIVSAGDVITRGQALSMPPTPSPTFQLVLVPTARPEKATPWPTLPPTPTATATHAIFRQHVQPTDDWTAYHDRVAQSQASMNLSAAQATAAAAPPSQQSIASVCNRVAQLESQLNIELDLAVIISPTPDLASAENRLNIAKAKATRASAPVSAATLEAVCAQSDTNTAQQELSAATVALDAAQANYDLAAAPPSAEDIAAVCGGVTSTLAEEQRVTASQAALDQLIAPLPQATIDAGCNTLQLAQRRDQEQQKLDQLLAPIPAATKEAACYTADLIARRDSAQSKLNALSGSVPEPTRVACWRKVYKLDNDLYQGQTARDHKIRSDPKADWNTLQAPLLEMEDVIKYETSLCQQQDAIEAIGAPHQIAQAGSDLMLAQSDLDRQISECNSWAAKTTVGDEWQIQQARTNVQIAQTALDNQQTQCQLLSTTSTIGNDQQIAAARAALESAKIALSTAQQNVSQQSNQCQIISTKQHSVTDAELIAINASLQAVAGRLSAAQSRFNTLVNANDQNAIKCQDLAARPHAVDAAELELIEMELKQSELAYQAEVNAHDLQALNAQSRAGERSTRIKQLQTDIQSQHKLCYEITNQQHQRDGSAMQVALAQYDVAAQRYRSSLSTPTPVFTWTPIPIWSATPLPSDTPTVTPTPTATPDATATPDDGAVRSQIAGVVVEVRLAGISGNDATVEILVMPEALPGLGSVMPATGGTIQSSGSISAFFTKTDVNVEQELIKRIQAAQTSIDAAIFEFGLTGVANAMIQAQQRGVLVRVVTDDEHGLHHDNKDGRGQFAMITGAGIEVKDDNRSPLMHNKFFIFDSRTVWTGSTNITVNGTQKNNNNVIVFESPGMATIYQREFDEMWSGQFGSRSPSQERDQRVELDGVPVEVLFGPEDSAIGRLTGLIMSAQSSVRFMAFSFTHDAIGGAMAQMSRQGVQVTGIFEARASKTEYSELPMMHCDPAMTVRRDGNGNTFHHKAIIIDDQIVITGSFNFSKNASENNDENLVIVWSPEIAAAYNGEFDRRWLEGKESDYVCK